MHIEIDHGRCEGYAVCVQSAPDLFALDDDGESVVLQPEPDAEHTAGALLAQTSCPMKAVRIS
jgi:ferredoxin